MAPKCPKGRCEASWLCECSSAWTCMGSATSAQSLLKSRRCCEQSNTALLSIELIHSINFANKRKAAVTTKKKQLWQKCSANLISAAGVGRAGFSVPRAHRFTAKT